MYRVNVTPVVGLPQFGGWSQVVSSNFSSSQLVCAFSIAGDHAGNAGRDFTEQISQAQANSPQELQQLVDKLRAAAAELGVEIQLACGVFTLDKVILGTIGGSVFLKRGDRTGVLLSSVEQVKIVEGKRTVGDVVVLITHQATDFVNEIKQKFASGFDTDSVVTSIIPGLHGLNDSSLSSIAFVTGGRELNGDVDGDHKDEEAIEEEVVVEPPVLDIPPALKLRGAGKNRAEETEVSDDDNLVKLGQVNQDEAAANPTVKIKQGLSLIVTKVIVLFKQINWRSILVKIVGFLSRLKVLALAGMRFVVVLFRKITARDIYLKKTSPRNLIRIILPVIAGVVVIGSLIGFRVYKTRQQLKNANAVIDPIMGQLDLAKGQLESDPIAARESVSQAITALEQLENDFEDQKKAQQLVADQLISARELYDQISGQEEFSQLEIFYDLRLADNEFVVSALDATAQQVVFLDSGKKQVIVLDLKNKQVKQINLSEADKLTDLELTDSTVTVLGNGVLAKDLKNGGDVFVKTIDEGDSNREATLIEGFATYLYILNPEKRNIYRYSKQEDGYSDPIGWVSGAAGFDYNQVSSWAIDGEMWVATRDGGLHKLASGQEQDFKVTGLAKPFTHALQVFTHEDLENLYVLEPDGKRLVVLNKKGEFLKEIKSDSLSSTTALFVSEELGNAFAVSGSIVYAMSI
jgi:hypothetical protein